MASRGRGCSSLPAHRDRPQVRARAGALPAGGGPHGYHVAIYRIAVQGWSKEQALREMQDGGYGFHGAWQDLVQFVNDLDIDRIKQKAGIKDAVHHVSLKDPPQTHALSSPWNAKLFGMRGYPGIPPGMTESQFFPLIDEFGQYRHADWPGKIHCADDLAQQKAAEADELEHHPGPTDWDIYGGWQAGPQLAATGRFRTEKLNGKWWLVDPVGRLFWSHGIDSVHTGWSTTPITDRERWFTRLPAKDSPYGKFYGRGNWAPHNYYEGKSYETYDFSAANLQRKYGNDWGRQFHALLHRRLRSWGLNTIGNWSEPSICQVRKTPYVVTIHSSGRTLEGSQGYWGKFADVFDSGFAASIRADAARQRVPRPTTHGAWAASSTTNWAGAPNCRWPKRLWLRPPISPPSGHSSPTCGRSIPRLRVSTRPGERVTHRGKPSRQVAPYPTPERPMTTWLPSPPRRQSSTSASVAKR